MITKNHTLFLFCILCAYSLHAQKYFNNWNFGNGAALSFNTSPPKVLTNSKLHSYEGCSSISDSMGNLLFYTNGENIWNKNHDTMKNGFGLLGHNSSTQSALIVKQPGNANIYYIFTSDLVDHYLDTNQENYGVNYSIVDIKLNNGLGEVISKNNLLFKNSNEKLTAVKHSNGQDIWIATIKRFTDSIFIYKLSDTGLSNPIIYKNNGHKIGYVDGSYSSQIDKEGTGQMKFSPIGNYLAYVELNSGRLDTNYIHLFDFNNNNGTLSNYKRIISFDKIIFAHQGSAKIYGLEFSPNEKYIYYSKLYFDNCGIFQLPINKIKHNINVNQIKTKLDISTFNPSFFALQLAPNGKIYIANRADTFLSVINNPDSLGLKSNFEFRAVSLKNKKSTIGLPNCVQSQIYLPIQIETDTSCTADSTKITLKYTDVQKIKWQLGDGNIKESTTNVIKHFYKDTGTYKIIAIVTLPNGGDTIIYGNIFITKIPKPNLGNDTILCPNAQVVIKDINNTINMGCLWNTKDTTKTITVHKAGAYILTNRYKYCTLADTINISIGKNPMVYIGNDTAFCHAFSIDLNAGVGYKYYQWNTGQTNYNITIDKQGLYHVKVADSNYCETADTIDIKQLPPPKITITQDTILCDRVKLTVIAQKGIKYLWSNNDTGAIANAYTKGNYWVRAYHPFCYNADTIAVNQMPKPEIFIGNDTIICKNHWLKAPIAQNYLWSNGSSSNSINVTETGTYWVRIKQNNCFNSDTIILEECLELSDYIPTAFTPNADGTNNEFMPIIFNSKQIKLQIYNRWGELIYQEISNQPSWNGNYLNQACQEGIYLYQLSITDLKGRKYFKNGLVNLLR